MVSYQQEHRDHEWRAKPVAVSKKLVLLAEDDQAICDKVFVIRTLLVEVPTLLVSASRMLVDAPTLLVGASMLPVPLPVRKDWIIKQNIYRSGDYIAL
jgi:hypothetical protein